MSKVVDKLFALGIALLLAGASLAQGSFRTAEGKLIEEGMSAARVAKMLGTPDERSRPSVSVNNTETWAYRLRDARGHEYRVRIRFAGGEAQDLQVDPLRTS